jgi:hypothetical protein
LSLADFLYFVGGDEYLVAEAVNVYHERSLGLV